MSERMDKQPELPLPPKLAEDLSRLCRHVPEVPPDVEADILERAEGYFRRQRLVRRAFRRAGIAGLAAAAALAVVVWRGGFPSGPQESQVASAPPALTPTARPAAPEDIDGNGHVDILDAFALARLLDGNSASGDSSAASQKRNTATPAGPDLNADGRVDQEDVDLVAMAAVRLRDEATSSDDSSPDGHRRALQ
ncbi:MAG: hypothetical protein AMXMBFR13_03580 [Phycisphaerae bacterium]